MIKNILFFLNKPFSKDETNRASMMFFMFLLYILFIYAYALILKGLDTILDLPRHSAFNTIKQKPTAYIILMGLLIAPFFEELTFRLILGLNKKSLSIGLFFIVYFFGNLIFEHPKYSQFDMFSFYLICVALMVSLIVYFYADKINLLSFLKKDFKWLLWFSILSFTFMHINNLQIKHNWQYLLSPIILMPQFLMGVFLSYMRCKFGLKHSIIMHGLFNFFPVLLFVLAKHFV